MKEVADVKAKNPAYKRQEGFRLSFKESLPCTFTILKIQGRDVESKKGSIHIINISLKGAKIISPLDLPIPNTHILLDFVIMEERISLSGELIWKKNSYNGYMYGVTFDSKTYSVEQLLTGLKNYVKSGNVHE